MSRRALIGNLMGALVPSSHNLKPHFSPKTSRVGGKRRARDRCSEHSPDICKERIVTARVSPHAIDVRGGPVKFGPVRILQADAEIEPWPKRGAAMAERQIRELEDPAGAVRAAGEGAVKRRIGVAANRDPSGSKAPRLIVNIRNRGVQRSQLVVGIVGETERLAGTRVVVFVYPGETCSDRVGIAEILVLRVDPDVGEGIVSRADGTTFDASPKVPISHACLPKIGSTATRQYGAMPLIGLSPAGEIPRARCVLDPNGQ